jgi:hypothetical protein
LRECRDHQERTNRFVDWKVAPVDLPQWISVARIGDVDRNFHQPTQIEPDRGECTLQVLENLDRLSLEIAGADDIAEGVPRYSIVIVQLLLEPLSRRSTTGLETV